MSQLIIKGHTGKQYKLNVTQFRSPMTAAINSVQTRKMIQHFPIRSGQPDINFTCKFRSNEDKHLFQAFVRDHQINAQTDNTDMKGMVTLWWPERNIENWTGYITEFRVVETRFVYAPSVTFGVALVDSLMSERTRMASFGSPLANLLGQQIPPYQGPGPLLDDSLLRPPTPPSASNSETSSPSATPPAAIPVPLGGGR